MKNANSMQTNMTLDLKFNIKYKNLISKDNLIFIHVFPNRS